MPLQAADMLANYTWNRVQGMKTGEPYSRVHRTVKTCCHYDKETFEKLFAREQGEFSIDYPEATLTFRPPAQYKVNVGADFSAVNGLVEELGELVKEFPNLVYPLVKDAASVAKLIRVDAENVPAAGTGNLRVTLKPTELFLSRMAAFRALKRNKGLGE